MVLRLQRLVCFINILRPYVEGAFLLDRSFSTAFVGIHRTSQQPVNYKMATQNLVSDGTYGTSLHATNIGQQDISRNIAKAHSDGDEVANDTEKEVSPDYIDGNDDEISFGNKSWREHLDVSIAKSRKIRGANYVQIATVDSITHEPRCRTVVFRGFLNTPSSNSIIIKLPNGTQLDTSTSIVIDAATNKPMSCIMKMCTDSRSEKMNQTGPTEVVWWFQKTSEQYRIRGTMVLIGNEPATEQDHGLVIARKELWGSLSDSSRESFLTTQRPGDIYANETSTGMIDQNTENRANGGRDENGKVIQPPPDTFLLMLVIPNRCDYLRLTNSIRQVDVLSDAKWQTQRVNP